MIGIGGCHPRDLDLEHRNLPDLHCGFGVTQDMPASQGVTFIPTH